MAAGRCSTGNAATLLGLGTTHRALYYVVENLWCVSLDFLRIRYVVRVYPQHFGGQVAGFALLLRWNFFHLSSPSLIVLGGTSAELRCFCELLFQSYGKTRFLTVIEMPSPSLEPCDPASRALDTGGYP